MFYMGSLLITIKGMIMTETITLHQNDINRRAPEQAKIEIGIEKFLAQGGAIYQVDSYETSAVELSRKELNNRSFKNRPVKA